MSAALLESEGPDSNQPSVGQVADIEVSSAVNRAVAWRSPEVRVTRKSRSETRPSEDVKQLKNVSNSPSAAKNNFASANPDAQSTASPPRAGGFDSANFFQDEPIGVKPPDDDVPFRELAADTVPLEELSNLEAELFSEVSRRIPAVLTDCLNGSEPSRPISLTLTVGQDALRADRLSIDPIALEGAVTREFRDCAFRVLISYSMPKEKGGAQDIGEPVILDLSLTPVSDPP